MHVCTFGLPHVLSWQGANYYNKHLGLGASTLSVIQNNVDFVTIVAPGSFGYRHIRINLLAQCSTHSATTPHVWLLCQSYEDLR